MGHSRIRVLLASSIGLFLLALLMAPLGSAYAQGNLLANASFEGGSYVYNNDGDQRVPDGWAPWWTSPQTNGCYNFKPHYELEQHPSHVQDGSTSARYYTAYSSHNGGLMQTVAATVGTRYRFSIYGFAWSTDDPVVDTPSTTYTKLWVGIDPTGGTNGDASTVVWSPENAQMDKFALFSVDAVAKASHITVFTRSRPDWCVARNDSFWDAATLTAVSGTGLPPAQQPIAPSGSVTATATLTLNIRSGPTIYNEIIGYLPAGASATVLGRDAVSQWIYIDRNGTKGWVAGWLCTISGDLNSLPVVGSSGAPVPQPPANAPATGGVTATPSVTLNMRSGPAVTFSVVGYALAGVALPVVGRDASSTWLLLSKNGTQGWVAAWLCAVSGDLNSVPVGGGGSAPPVNPPPSGGGVAATANLTLNMRSGPSTNHDIVGYVPSGATVTVLGRADDSQWIYVDRNGTKGWIAGWLCTISGDLSSVPVTGHTGNAYTAVALTLADSVTAVSGYDLNLRSAPNFSSATIGTIPAGKVLTVTGRDASSDWLFVTYNGAQGWVARWLCTVTGILIDVPVVQTTGTAGQPPPPPSGSPAPGGVTATTTNMINIRSGPNVTFAVIGTLPGGAVATVVGRTDDSQWIQITYNGTTGWVAGFLCAITGDVNSLPVTGHTGSTSTSGGGTTPTIGASSFELGGQVPDSIAHADYMHSAKMTWVKMQEQWSPGASPYNVAGKINEAHSKGFKILVSITGTGHPFSIDFGSYANFVGGVAGLGADGIEVWNEMNFDREWPTYDISGASYVTKLLIPASAAIRAANPGTLIISGAPTPSGAFGGCGYFAVTGETGCDDSVYIQQMKAAGAANYVDCIGVHFNAGATPPSVLSGHPNDPGDHHYSWYYLGMYNLYYGTFGKPLCFTELGYASAEGLGPVGSFFPWANYVSVAQQASWLAQTAIMASQSKNVRLLIVWNVDFTSSVGNDPQAAYAIVRPDNSCPACSALAGALP